MPRSDISKESGGIELVRAGKEWQISFRGRVLSLPHTNGVTYLATLLASPCREIPATAVAGHDPHEADPLRVESDRLKVTKSIKRTLRAISERDARIGFLLRASIHTGHRCSYRPPPDDP